MAHVVEEKFWGPPPPESPKEGRHFWRQLRQEALHGDPLAGRVGAPVTLKDKAPEQ